MHVSNQAIRGGCLCGAIRYEARGEPLASTLCHCQSCRRASGAPSLAWLVFKQADFAFALGEPVRYESTPGVIRTFCGACGTSLTYQRESKGGSIDVTTATLDHPDDFAPSKEIWVSEKLAWESLNGDAAVFPGSSKGAAVSE